MKALFLGSRGTEVKLLQSKLGLISDGSFGPVTLVKLKQYQAYQGLVADGACGAKTWARLLTTPVLDFSKSDYIFNILKVNKRDISLRLSYNVDTKSIKYLTNLYKPDFIMNAGMYNNNPRGPGYGLTLSDTIMFGKVVGGGNYVPRGFGFSPDKDGEICTTEQAKINCRSYIGFSPDLHPAMNLKGLSLAFARALAYRTGLGTKGEFIYFITTNKTMTLAAFKQKFIDLGCTEAGNFDGGGSTQSAFYTDFGYVKQTDQTDSRKNATYLMFDVK
jgi:hypothetical protein